MLIKYEKIHINQCLELFLDIFINTPWNYNWMTEEKIYKYFVDLENTPEFLGMVYYENNIVIGFCLGIINNYFVSKTFDIKEICIKREQQGKGNGSQMLSEISIFLKDINVECITLATQKDIAAFEFYKKNGYNGSNNTIFMSKNIYENEVL